MRIVQQVYFGQNGLRLASADDAGVRSLNPQAMAVDKKVADGELRLILLKGPLGGCLMTGEYDEGAMRATIQDFCDRQ